MRAVMWTLIIASGLAALALSFQGLEGLATMMGIQPAGLFPVSVDITTTAATIAWLAGDHASRTGRTLALASITASVVGNAVFHFLELANGYALLASVVAAVPPIMLAAVVHLGALLATPPGHRQEVGEAGEVAGEKLVTSEDIRQEPLPHPTQPVDEDADLASKVAALRQAARDAGERPPGRQKLAEELGVTPHQVRAALEEIASRGNPDRQDAGDDHQEPRQIAR